MIFTPYTQPVKPAEFVGTVDLNVYAKGLANQQQMYEQNLKSLTDDFSKLFNRNAYGPDKERLKALENQLREEVGSINLSDLTDMGTSSKIRNIVRSYGSDPQMQAIFKRTNIYDSETEKRDKAMEKGESYTSPALESLGDYFNQENFYEKPKNLNLSTGWISPPTQKWMKEAREAVKKKVLNTATGVVEEIIDPIEARDYYMQLASSDPRFKKQLDYDFKKQTEGIDWSTEGQNYINQKLEEKRAEINQARLSRDKEAELLATREFNDLEKMSDPSLVGEELQNQYFNSWIQNGMDKTGYSMDMVSFVDYKRDPVYMEKLRTQNNITEARLKAYIDAGYDPYTKQPIMVGDQSLADIKQAEKAKEEKAKSTTQKQKDIEIVINAINSQGKVTADHVNRLADKGEVVVLNKDNATVKINYGKYWDEATEKMILPERNSVVIPLEDYIKNRTGIDIKLKKSSKDGTTGATGSMASEMPK